MSDLDQLSKTEREALKAIHRLSIERRKGDEIEGARTGDLSDELGLTPGTITATLKRLAEEGYVNHQSYHGVTLTERGMRSAVAATRRHRITERFLCDMLGYKFNQADILAPLFEHALPPEIETRMYEVMGRPQTCPHGFVIPEADEEELPEMDSLFELPSGQPAVIALPGSMEEEVVTYLETLGIHPGVSVEVTENRSYDGLVELTVNGEQRTVGERVARQIYVRKETRKEQSA